jgi:hypothetical protein
MKTAKFVAVRQNRTYWRGRNGKFARRFVRSMCFSVRRNQDSFASKGAMMRHIFKGEFE